MSSNGYSTPNQPIRSRSPAAPIRRVDRADTEDFSEFDALVARNPVPVLEIPPSTPVRQNAIRMDTVPPMARRRIVRVGIRPTEIPPPGGEPRISLIPPPGSPVMTPRRRSRSPRSRSNEPPTSRIRY